MRYLSKDAEQIFRALIGHLNGKESVKIDNSNGAFIPVTIELLYKTSAVTVYSVTHWVGPINGDLCRDCDMTFALTKEGIAVLEYQADFTGTYHEAAIVEGGRVVVQDQREYNDLVLFANEWMENIKEQQCLAVK